MIVMDLLFGKNKKVMKISVMWMMNNTANELNGYIKNEFNLTVWD